MDLNKVKVNKILSGFSDKNILVIGDIMLDAYFWGKTERISPEAPVPIIEVNDTNYNPGGAGNVALNLSTLGAKVSVIATVGNDSNGEVLINQLEDKNIDTSNILILENYQTPIKTRVIAHDQQVIRIDQEDNSINIDQNLSILEKELKNNIKDFDGVIIADYNKGLLSKKFIKSILKFAEKYSIPIYVDPKNDNFYEYKNVRLFKPNIAEFKDAIGTEYSERKILNIGKKFQRDSFADLLLITRGAKDALLFTKNKNENIPTVTQSVHDVSGAGDTVISVFALSDLSGAKPNESANIANIAASIVCSKVGVAPLHIVELKEKLLS